MNKLYIGIDPDVDKSGVAMILNGHIELHNMRFFELFEYLKNIKHNRTDYDIMEVYVEAGWLNKSNWHKVRGTAAINAKIGERTGANFETGKKILEMLEYLNIKHYAVRPSSTKMGSRILNKITGVRGRTNQEQRDALMLIYGRK